jgi:hypothetical protein
MAFLLIEWAGRSDTFAIKRLFSDQYRIFRWGFYYILLFSIIICCIYTVPQEFIYFQF